MQDYFLGANSAEGFTSLYGGFPPGPGAFLHVLKGGPGTGKSSMLRAIAAAANERGLEVQRVLCSGDPDSLDGVYLPSLGLAWADGTAPHALEPGLFGVNGDYVNLGSFFICPFSAMERERLLELQREYKCCYQRAYGLLTACEAMGGGRCEDCPDDALRRAIAELPDRGGSGQLTKRFQNAITCKGLIRLPDGSEKGRNLPAPASALPAAAEEARRKGWDAILCLSPLCPRQAEALLLPDCALAFRAVPDPAPESRPLLEAAVEALREAKTLHDGLEALYRPHMDFAGLTEFTEKLLRELFSEE